MSVTDLSEELKNAGNELQNARIDFQFPSDAAGLSPTPRNKRLTVYPGAITFPTNADQVAKIVEIGGKYQLRVVALGGGHGATANGIGGSSGALVISLGKLKGINYHSYNQRITVQAGNTLGDVNNALEKYKRAIPMGDCFTIGIGGHAAFGGYGAGSRMWGLNHDAIYSMDIVTDDGTQKTCSATDNQDLFWAMRGAAPSFAIATSITFNTYPVPQNTIEYKYIRSMSYQDAAAVISKFQESAYTDNVPKELGLQFRMDKGPDSNRLALTLRGNYYGPGATFYNVIEPFLKGILGVLDTESTRTEKDFPPATNPDLTKNWAGTINEGYYDAAKRGANDPSLTGDSLHLAKAIGDLIRDSVNSVGAVAGSVFSGLGTVAQAPTAAPAVFGNILSQTLHGITGAVSDTVGVIHAGATDALHIANAQGALINQVINPEIPPPAALASFYLKSLMAPELNEAALVALMKYAVEKGSNFGRGSKSDVTSWYVALKLLGGKDSAIKTAAPTSFGWRNAFWLMEYDADGAFPIKIPVPPASPYPDSGYTFLDGFVKAVTDNMPGTSFGAYPGFPDDKLADYQQHYYGDNYQRLVNIKRASFKTGVFTFPQNIGS